MKLTRDSAERWTLSAENALDVDFVGEVFMNSRVHPEKFHKQEPDTPHLLTGVTLCVTPVPLPSVADALNDVGRSLSQLLGLLARQPAYNGHVGALATHPQAQEPLPADLVQIQSMLQARGYAVVKQQVVEEILGTHGGSSFDGDGTRILSEGGAA